MQYDCIHLIYFSPTHSSAKVAHAIAENMDVAEIKVWDLTYDEPEKDIHLENGLAIIAMPVYGGRVAGIALQRLKRITAGRLPAIPVVVYGNRDYEDALVELCDTLKVQGFIPVAGGAFVGEHSFSTKEMPIAQGRPDINDLLIAGELARQSLTKIEAYSTSETIPDLQVKGNIPYKTNKASDPQAPLCNSQLCTQCGYCIDICPTKAISLTDDSTMSDPALCIKCCACTKECPEGARSFETPFRAFLHQNFNSRREPELFI